MLRPTAVFGPGGKNLLKLIDDLAGSGRTINYLRSSLFGSRKMNLVYVSNVVSAIEFLIRTTKHVDDEVFIISDDEFPSNNYRFVEKCLVNHLGYEGHLLPEVDLPPLLLKGLLKLSQRSNINPRRIYDCGKLQSIGFTKPSSFEDGLARFANWYKETTLSRNSDRK